MEEETNKERLDQFVAREMNLSRKGSVDLIKGGKVKLNGQVSLKPSIKIAEVDKVKISSSALKVPKLPKLKLPVIYEDENVAVINKPMGVLTHSKGAYNPEPTVASWLESSVPAMKGNRAGIVHRLDRATSGVMILAKNPETLSFLQKQFSQRRTKKIYSAVIEGELTEPEAIIDMPIERNPKKPQTFRVGVNGKAAITGYKVIKTNVKSSLLELKPVTGRTHQLRVHLRQMSHPIVGDVLYGGREADRLYLHAKSLEITLPGGERKIFEAETPKQFEEYVS